MSKVTLSSALFEQMGGVNWQRRPDMTMSLNNSEHLEPSIGSSSTEKGVTTSTVVEALETSSNMVLSHSEIDSELPVSTAEERPAIVVLGAGLNEIWQNESQPAWLLWQNIMLTFRWDEAQVVFFDTTQLVSEEIMFTTMEEIIELGVDWVFTMDESHELSEILQEGVQVISVPEIESMLMDPYAKQTFYHAAVSIVKMAQ